MNTFWECCGCGMGQRKTFQEFVFFFFKIPSESSLKLIPRSLQNPLSGYSSKKFFLRFLLWFIRELYLRFFLEILYEVPSRILPEVSIEIPNMFYLRNSLPDSLRASIWGFKGFLMEYRETPCIPSEILLLVFKKTRRNLLEDFPARTS